MSEAWKLFECCSHLNMIAHFSVMALNLTLSWNSSFYYKLRILLLTIGGKKKKPNSYRNSMMVLSSVARWAISKLLINSLIVCRTPMWITAARYHCFVCFKINLCKNFCKLSPEATWKLWVFVKKLCINVCIKRNYFFPPDSFIEQLRDNGRQDQCRKDHDCLCKWKAALWQRFALAIILESDKRKLRKAINSKGSVLHVPLKLPGLCPLTAMGFEMGLHW